MKKVNHSIIFLGILLTTLNATGQSIPTLRTRVSPADSINIEKDKSYGVGDDGTHNIMVPTVKSSSDFKSFKAGNIHDFNLTSPWIEGKSAYGIGEYLEYTFDRTPGTNKDSAFSINSFFVINGYRKDLKTWEQYSRVKKLKLYINNVPFAFIFLMDTYKFQSVNFQDYWIKGGEKKVMRFEIMEVYKGTKFKNAALSELEFSGKYERNGH
jgi:hypothetical protein